MAEQDGRSRTLEIIAHRGYWLAEEEKNSALAFERALGAGFGIETDLRDSCGRVVVSHDPPGESSMRFETLLELYSRVTAEACSQPTLALNIKSDGICSWVSQLLNKYKVKNYFVFDMSVPDSISYLKAGLTTFMRQSEFECHPSFYEECDGVWLDCFLQTWFSKSLITSHVEAQKHVCIVSPELHKRKDFINEQWMMLRGCRHGESMSLCTDFPKQARDFFNV